MFNSLLSFWLDKNHETPKKTKKFKREIADYNTFFNKISTLFKFYGHLKYSSTTLILILVV